MAFGLLGAHVNASVHGVPDLVADWKPPLVVVLDHSDAWHGVKAASPKTVFVGRNYSAVEPDFNNPNLDPIQAARDHCSQILPWAEKMGTTYGYWQGVNEPILSSAEAMRRYAGFDAERARIMKGHGFRVVVGSFSVGHPTKMAHWKHYLPALEAASQFKGALALHEYAWPTLDRESPWYLLRHRKVYDGEAEHQWQGLPRHLKTLPLFITECGLDGLIEHGHPPRGFRALHGDNPENYLRELAWFNAQLKKDPYVRGAAIYCCGGAGPTWQSYDIWPEPVGTLARQATPVYRRRKPKPPKQTGPAPTPAPEPVDERKPKPPKQTEPAPTPAPEPGDDEKEAKAKHYGSVRRPAIPMAAAGASSLRTRPVVLAPDSPKSRIEAGVHKGADETTLGTDSGLAPPPEPSRPPESPPPASSSDLLLSGDEEAMLEQVLNRLDQIITLLAEKL
jgi:hypothetical protein